jgi:lipoprotein signal peptidase
MSRADGKLSRYHGMARRGPALLRQAPARDAIGLCAFLAAFYFAYNYGMAFSQASASPFWFPDSVLLAALLLVRPGNWWIVIVAVLPIRLFAPVAAGIPL